MKKAIIWIFGMILLSNAVFAEYPINRTSAPHSEDEGENPTMTTPCGAAIKANIEVYINGFNMTEHSTATRGWVKINDSNVPFDYSDVLAECTFSGSFCKFNTPYKLIAGTSYYVLADNSGDVHHCYQSSGAYPYNYDDITFEGGMYNQRSGEYDASCFVIHEIEVDVPSTPIITNYNITSNNTLHNTSTGIWNLGEIAHISSDLLSLTLTTTLNANCSAVLDNDLNYSTAVDTDMDYKFATTETTSHAYLLPSSMTLGNHCLYIHCVNSSTIDYDTGSGCLSVSRWENVSITPKTSGYCSQYVQVHNYTNINLTYNLTVNCYNPNTHLNFTNITIKPPAGFGGEYVTIQVTTNSSNSASFLNISSRGTSDGGLYTIPGSDITVNVSMTTNSIKLFNPIDPPYAFTKDGIVDCDKGMFSNVDITIPYTLKFNGAGEFLIGNILRAKGFEKNAPNCIVAINNTGRLVIG